MRALLLSLGLLVGCKETPKPAAPEVRHSDEEEHGALPKQVRLDPNAIAEAGIRTEPAKRAALALTVTLPGEVTSEPDRTARVSAATAGRLDSVTFNEGSVVKKGDVLATLRVPDVGRLRGALAGTQAKAKAARANAARLKSLRESG
ncbi:MAG: efflux RND transporter periplasmic adaptor subunit, partial [Myxococcaceae bacterium]|nr:efflux RND transporter periplasmic adaptor subunit [Myxococcaceae bacterium]